MSTKSTTFKSYYNYLELISLLFYSHNNPYSRRHTCGVCGFTLENQTALQAHLEKVHAPKALPHSSSSSSVPCASPTTPLETPQPSMPQAEAQDLSMSPVEEEQDEKSSLVCPVENCPTRFSDTNTLAVHLQKDHITGNSTRCPHCSYCLTKDESAKDHWLTHHQDVCAACVLVFTSVYGPQLWKKVHVKPSGQDSPLDAIVSGLSRKRSAPGSGHDSTSSDSEHSAESVSAESDHPDSDSERLCKRSRKQSCPKKVITVVNEENMDEEDDEASEEDTESRSLQHKRKKTRRCIRCPHRPVFATHARLQAHRRTKHRTTRLLSTVSSETPKIISPEIESDSAQILTQ